MEITRLVVMYFKTLREFKVPWVWKPNATIPQNLEVTITKFYFHTHQFAMHLCPQIAKARRGGRRGKVPTVITDDIVN